MWARTEKEIREHLAFWSGANAQVWEYTCGHGLLLIRLFRPGYRFDLYVLCADCRTVRFSSAGWVNAKFQLQTKQDPKQNEPDFKFQLEDGERLFVTCWGLSVIESEKQVLIDWPPESRKIFDNRILI